jgi:hypothetical protein
MMLVISSGRSWGSSESILTCVIARVLDDGREEIKIRSAVVGQFVGITRYRIALWALSQLRGLAYAFTRSAYLSR